MSVATPKRLLIVGIFSILLGDICRAQISVLTKPSAGGVEITDPACHFVKPGIAPDYSVSVSIPGPDCPSSVCTTRATEALEAVSGKISVAPREASSRGGSKGNFEAQVYTTALPGSNVRIKFKGELFIKWNGPIFEDHAGFYFDALSGDDKGLGIDWFSAPFPATGEFSDSTLYSAAVQVLPGQVYESGGKAYYKVGVLQTDGKAEIGEPSNSIPISGEYRSAITGLEAYYIGNALTINDGDNQPGLVNSELPKALSVKVANGETGVTGSALITFSIVDPANGVKFFGDSTSIQVNTVNGIASARLILGSAPGTYTVKAICPDAVCTSGAKEVIFTATALTRQQATELRSDTKLCELYGVAGRQMTPFRVVAVNNLTGAVETGVTIRYERVSFTDIQGNTSLTFPEDSTFRYKKLTGGYESATLTPGSQEGTYAVKAVCDDCLGNASVVCHGYVRNMQVPAGLPSASSANPFDRDPITGKPLTPVVRIQEMATQNSGNSFTTDVSENLVTFKALVLPEDFAEQSEITWNVIDDPRDNFSSPVPAQNPVSQSGSKYEAVYRVWLDSVYGGRPAPLKYLVTAKAVVEDKEVLSPYRELKQDEIDKCRQEYVDYSIGLGEVPRTTFTAGLHSEYSKQVRDCFAYIYPGSEADKVDKLRAAGYAVSVTSGYRSPRHNIRYVGSTARSTHIYGEAVDINPIPAVHNAIGWKALWEASQTTCGKILETGSAQTMLWCANGGSSEELSKGRAFPSGVEDDRDMAIYEMANCIHLGNLSH